MDDINFLQNELNRSITIKHRDIKRIIRFLTLIGILIISLLWSIAISLHIIFLTDNKPTQLLTEIIINVFLIISVSALIINYYSQIYNKIYKTSKDIYSYINDIIKFKSHFEVILDSLQVSVCIFDNNFKYIYANRENEVLSKKLGFQDYLGKSLLDLIPKAESSRFADTCRAVIKEYVKKSIEIKLIFMDKTEVLYNVDIYPIDVGIIVFGTDITEKKKIENELQKNQIMYTELFNYANDSILVTERVENDLKFIDVNEIACKLFGYQKEEFLALSPVEVYHQNNLYRERLEKVFAQKASTDTLIYRGKDGSLIPMEANARLAKINDRQIVISILRDVTERKKLEEVKKDVEASNRLLNDALEYDKMKTEFFSNISHELRTPLNIILGTLQLHDIYEKGNINEYNYKKYFKVMKQNCNRLLRLINNLIDITKIDAGFYELNLKNCNIVSVIEDVALSVADYVVGKGIYIEFETDTEEKIIACDPDKIERIVLNIMSNAIKHTYEGGKIYVSIEDGDDYVSISIRDTGEGIPADLLKSIFERFKQVDKILTRRSEGSGIGLSLVKSLVELHQGSIDVKSTVGQGTEFIFKLPSIMCNPDSEEIENKYGTNRVERISIEFSDIYRIN